MLYQTLQGGGIWQEMESSRIQYRGTFAGSAGNHFYQKTIAANTDATYAIFRKLQDSYAGESADDIYAVAGQLRKSSGAIITMLGNYERVLKELAGVYEDTEKTVSRNAGRLKFGGMR